MFSEASPNVFSGLQLSLEGKFKAIVWVNAERLEVEVKQRVVAIPYGRVIF
jgi:hypothetical protein